MASEKIRALKINLAIGFTRKNALVRLYNDAVPWLNDLQPTLKISKFTCISSASLPAVRPGCARCRAPEISHNKGNGGGFTKMLFRRRFTHCAMAILFILHSLPCSSIFGFSKVRISPKVTIACNGFCLLRHTKTWLSRDIISCSGEELVASQLVAL